MKQRTVVCLGALVAAALVFASMAVAREAMVLRGSGGWGAGLPYSRLYRPATMQTLRGQVLKLEKLVPEEGMSDGLRMVLKTKEEILRVHLGPDWYLERQDFALRAKDHVEVVGSRVTLDGEPVIIAAEVKKVDKVLSLRQADGFPLWSAWRRR